MAPKNPAAVALGRRGGRATARNLSAEERSAKMRRAAEARWAKTKAELQKLTIEITEGTKRLERKIAGRAGPRKGSG
jgi:hypothetical protein